MQTDHVLRGDPARFRLVLRNGPAFTESLLVNIDPSRVFLSGRETLRDLFLEILVTCLDAPQSRYTRGDLDATSLMASLESLYGDRPVATLHNVVHPGAVIACHQPAGLVPPIDTVTITLDMAEGHAHIPGEGAIPMDVFTDKPADRRWTGNMQALTGRHPFRWRHHDGGEQTCDARDLAAGGLLTGLAGGLVGTSWGTYSEDAVTLAGIAAALGGWLAGETRDARLQEGDIVPRVLFADSALMGLLVSDRGWAPKRHLEGPHLARCRALAPEDTHALGARLAAVLRQASPQEITDATRCLRAELGLPRRSDTDRSAQETSAHARLRSLRLIREVFATAGATPPETLS